MRSEGPQETLLTIRLHPAPTNTLSTSTRPEAMASSLALNHNEDESKNPTTGVNGAPISGNLYPDPIRSKVRVGSDNGAGSMF